MSWSEAKAQIAAILDAVSITSPEEETIAHVYSDPPGTVQDLPCFIIYPPALDEVERSNGVRKKSYTVRLRLLVKDADLDKAAAFVDSYREAVVNAFDTELTLNGTAKLITGPRAEEASAFDYAGRSYTGIDFLLGVQIEEPMSFEP